MALSSKIIEAFYLLHLFDHSTLKMFSTSLQYSLENHKLLAASINSLEIVRLEYLSKLVICCFIVYLRSLPIWLQFFLTDPCLVI